MLKTCTDLLKKYPTLLEGSVGDLSASFTIVSPAEKATDQSLVFASGAKHLESALNGPASIIVTSKKLWGSKNPGRKGILFSEVVGVAQATITTDFMGRLPPKNKKVHPTAFVSESAHIGPDVTIGAFAFIGEKVSVGKGAYIGPHCVLEEQSEIGESTTLWAGVYVGHHCKIGKTCVVHPNSVIGAEGFGFAQDKKGQHYRIPQNGIVIIEDNVEIGALCTVDRAAFGATRVGEGSKFDDHVHVAHNCQLGKHALLVGGSMMGGSSEIGDNVFIGGGTFLAPHVKVTKQVSIGGLSGVTSDITESGLYGGRPIQPLKDYLRTTATMVHLVEMRKNIEQLMKSVLGKEQ